MDTVDFFLSSIVLIVGAAGAFVAITGETWAEEETRAWKKVTARGWGAIACITVTLTFSLIKEYRTQRTSAEATERADEAVAQRGKMEIELKEAKQELRESHYEILNLKELHESIQIILQPGDSYIIPLAFDRSVPKAEILFLGFQCALSARVLPSEFEKNLQPRRDSVSIDWHHEAVQKLLGDQSRGSHSNTIRGRSSHIFDPGHSGQGLTGSLPVGSILFLQVEVKATTSCPGKYLIIT